MLGVLPPLSQYAFMAWCSVEEKAQGQLYLYVIIYGNLILSLYMCQTFKLQFTPKMFVINVSDLFIHLYTSLCVQ